MNKSYIVYKHTNLINKKIYIGITKYGNKPNIRWRNGYGYVDNKKFYQDIEKYGWENFSHEILMKDLSEEEALRLENFYINLFDCRKSGYNNKDYSHPMSEEGIKAISQALTGITRSSKSIEKQMKTKKERYGSQRGIHSYNNIGKKVQCVETGDIFANISEAERWCKSQKVGECCRGHRQHAGRHPETNEPLTWKYADANAIATILCEEDPEKERRIFPVICIETQQVYSNATIAEKATGVQSCNILRVCRGKRKTAGKLHWEFYLEED